MLIPVLLSGGVGSRLWPVSRKLSPKQCLRIANPDRSMLQDTLYRLKELHIDGLSKDAEQLKAVSVDSADPIIVCNEAHRFLVAEQMREIGVRPQIMLEPLGRNTAPALALAALQATKNNVDAILLVLPADHVIADVDAFHRAINEGLALAEAGELVTFGIVPEKPETGYGYIKRGASAAGESAFRIEKFVEKPSLDVAQSYVSSGDHFWNSGMFLLRADVYLQELQRFAPEILESCEAAVNAAVRDLDFIRVDCSSFEKCQSDSIDYAVMEKTTKGVVVPLSCGWSDVGAWSTLWEVEDKDDDGNVLRGDTVISDVKNSYIRSESRLVAAVGVEDLVVVETPDAVLVADRNKVQDVKKIVDQLEKSGRNETNTHTKVYRPWGTYESLVVDERFQVKRISVNPGEKLSLQMHHHRAEHWVVVKGTALVTRGDDELLVSEDESTYIKLGTNHRLTNPGVIPLELIEVQTGSYLGEDDIVRFNDVYGRESE